MIPRRAHSVSELLAVSYQENAVGSKQVVSSDHRLSFGYIDNSAYNHVLGRSLLPINNAEIGLPRLTRVVLSQLKSGFYFLQSSA